MTGEGAENEHRTPIPIRIRKSIHRSAAQYSKFTGLSVGQLYEAAIIHYMETYKPDNITINVTNPEKKPANLKEKFAIDDAITELTEMLDSCYMTVEEQINEKKKEIQDRMNAKYDSITTRERWLKAKDLEDKTRETIEQHIIGDKADIEELKLITVEEPTERIIRLKLHHKTNIRRLVIKHEKLRAKSPEIDELIKKMLEIMDGAVIV